MENRNIESVAIVGAGAAGWMTAAFLSNMLGQSVAITLIDLADEHEPDLDDASLPPLKAFHNSLGINELDLIAKTQGSMKLGTQFVNWGPLGNRYFHPHGSYGAEFDAVPLHQWWLKARNASSETPSLEDLSMAWVLAREGRFSHPSPDRRLIQSTYDYAYHMDMALYSDYLATYAQSRGVKLISAKVSHVELNPNTGFVDHLTLENGQTVSSDLYVDCSGQQGVLIQQALKTGFDDWSAYLPCNRAISIACARGTDLKPFRSCTAREGGWQWRSALQHRTSTGYIYSADHISEDEALASLMDNLDGKSLGEPIATSLCNGRSKHSFTKNVVAIGGAAGFLEPLESTSMQLIQSALTRLLALWPTKACDEVVVNEYNQITAREWDLARDFLILHYKASSRTDSPLWRAAGEMTIPNSLAARLEHWTSFGRLISPGPEVFQSASWLAVFVGQNMMPLAWDPLADARSDSVDYAARLAGLKRVIDETAEQIPSHKDWIDKHGRGARSA